MSHPNIVHWDEVEEHDHEEGGIHSAWRYLGEAAGTVGVGVNRIRIHPGCRSTPLHSHGDHEEIFFVLGGLGLSWQRTERGEDVVCEVGSGTCLVHVALWRAASRPHGPCAAPSLAPKYPRASERSASTNLRRNPRPNEREYRGVVEVASPLRVRPAPQKIAEQVVCS